MSSAPKRPDAGRPAGGPQSTEPRRGATRSARRGSIPAAPLGCGAVARSSTQDLTADVRLRAGSRRDAVADARDVVASERDRAADARSLGLGADDPGDPQRTAAAEDRKTAAADRESAADERAHSRADRESLAHQLSIAEVDALTGMRTRAAGLAELERELARADRSLVSLVVAYTDVVGLKQRNDTEGHLAGDQLLQRVAALLTDHLRPYDLVIRIGGDEFLCAMSGMTLDNARGRFDALSRELTEGLPRGAITAGFAKFEPSETAAALIARADGELGDRRREHPDSRPDVASENGRTR